MTPDFVAVGHITEDRRGSRSVPGGSALYAALMARSLGFTAGLLTSFSDHYPFPRVLRGIRVVRARSPETTTFVYPRPGSKAGFRLARRASRLLPSHLPVPWRRAPVVLLCPVAGEVDPRLAACFPRALLGVAPQGWMRAWDRTGRVQPAPWKSASEVLPYTDALIVSQEDCRGWVHRARKLIAGVPLGVLTRGGRGATLFIRGRTIAVPPCPAKAVDSTGAGDVFAAAFLVRYYQTGSAVDAAFYAACAGASATEGIGVAGVPGRGALERRYRRYQREIEIPRRTREMAEERHIRIMAGAVKAEALLNRTKTADAIWNALPIEARGETWGDEIYFGIPVRLDEEDARAVVEMGDLGYWPPGHAFCIFFGPTPSSQGNEIRPSSPVNVFGRIVGDARLFKKIRSGTQVRIERA